MVGFLCSTVCSAVPWLSVESMPSAHPSRVLVAGFKLWWSLSKSLSLKNKTNAQAPFPILPLSAPSSPGLLIWEGREREGEGFLTTRDHHGLSLGWGEDKLRDELHEHPLPCLWVPWDLPVLRILGLDYPTRMHQHMGLETVTLSRNSCIYRLQLERPERLKSLPPHSKLCSLFVCLSRRSRRLN